MVRVTILLMMVLLWGCQDRKRAIAISKIKEASKLATTRTELTKMIFANQDKKFLGIIKLNQSRFVARTKAFVLAGVDLKKIKESDVRVNGQSISLQLPAVEVLDFSYPFSAYTIDYNLTEVAFANKISLEDHEELYRRAESQIRELLPFYGIKEATEEKTRQLLEQLLKSVGFEEVYITFPKGNSDFIVAVPLTDQELR